MHQTETTSSFLYSMNVLYLSPDKIMRIRNDADASTFPHYPTLEVKQKRTAQCSWDAFKLLWSTLVTVTLLQVLLTPTSTSTCNSNRIKLWPSSLSWAPSSFQLLSSYTGICHLCHQAVPGGWGVCRKGQPPIWPARPADHVGLPGENFRIPMRGRTPSCQVPPSRCINNQTRT